MQVTGHAFIVSGGASGLGAAAARALVEAGGRVLIADLDAVRGQELCTQLGAPARFERCDVTSAADCARVVAAAGELGPLRGLVGCAGIVAACKTVGRDGAHPLELFERVIAVNVVGTFNLLRLAAQAMCALPALADGERGIIVNTASIAAYDGQMGQAAYAASKGAVAALTLPVARDLAREGVRCMTIAPGMFATPMMAGMPAEVQQALGQQVPFPSRLGQPEEFARLVLAIVANPMLNGEVIRLDGALRMAPR